VEVHALLADVVHRPDDRHAARSKREIRILERLLAVHEKGDVTDAHPPGCRRGSGLAIGDREEVDGWLNPSSAMKHTPVPGVLLDDLEAEERGVELARAARCRPPATPRDRSA